MVVAKIATTTPHGAIPGKTQLSPTNYYNLDAIQVKQRQKLCIIRLTTPRKIQVLLLVTESGRLIFITHKYSGIFCNGKAFAFLGFLCYKCVKVLVSV